MGNKELSSRIQTHQAVVAELNRLAPEVEAHQLKISRFILTNPGLAGISYAGVELLMLEKDNSIREKANKMIQHELRPKNDPASDNFSFEYPKMSKNRVKKILTLCAPQKEKKHSVSDPDLIEVSCPYCKTTFRGTQEKRDKVISFRSSEIIDNPLTQLAERCGVSRSFLTNELLCIEQKYGYALKQK